MATVEFPGNAIPAPGYAKGGQTIDEELLFSAVGWTQKGVTLKPGQGILRLGTLIKQDPTTKRYVKATATNGSDALGVLRLTVNTGTDADGQAYLGNIVHMGMLKLAHLKSANPTVTSFDGVLGGRVSEVEGFFKF